MSIYHDNHLQILKSNISNSAVILLSRSKSFLQLRVCTRTPYDNDLRKQFYYEAAERLAYLLSGR